jgi:hypothetical protein
VRRTRAPVVQTSSALRVAGFTLAGSTAARRHPIGNAPDVCGCIAGACTIPLHRVKMIHAGMGSFAACRAATRAAWQIERSEGPRPRLRTSAGA